MSTSAVRPRTTTTVLTILAAVLPAGIGAAAIALLALALGADPAFPPLQPAVYLPFAVLGVLAAIGGWVLCVRLVRRSARALRVIVPAALVLSLVPDVVLLLTGFIPGTTPTAVFGLMIMHVLVAALAVVAGRRIAPAR